MPELDAFLLAAGNGRRAGGPKAWQPYEGRSLLERQLDFLLGRFPPAGIAVTIQEAWRDRCLKLHPQVRWVGEDPESSPLAALQALIRKDRSNWTFLHHVDMPVWEPGLFDALEGAIPGAGKAEAIAPAWEGKKGHPVLLAPPLLKAVSALDPKKDRLDHFLRTRRELAWPVPYPCVLENWNAGR